MEYKEEKLFMKKSKEEYAKELQGQTLSKPEALWYFGNEGEIRNYFGGRKKEFTGNTAKTFKKTLEQYFESVDDTVKVGRGKGYKLGVKARGDMEELLLLARQFENTVLTRQEAVGIFGTEGQKNHFEKLGRFRDKEKEKPFLKTLNQLFESVSYVKNGNRKDYKLGFAREEVIKRLDKRIHNGSIKAEEVIKNKESFLNNKSALNTFDDEEWLPVIEKSYGQFYYISNYGKIFSLQSGRVLKPHQNKEGYLLVSLSHRKETTSYLVHRLVALTFIENPDPENLIIVNHIDGNKSNPYYKNLEWVTPKENSWHAVRTGLRRFGSTCELKYKPKPLSVKIINESELSKSSRVKRKTPLASFLLENLEINKELINNFR